MTALFVAFSMISIPAYVAMFNPKEDMEDEDDILTVTPEDPHDVNHRSQSSARVSHNIRKRNPS